MLARTILVVIGVSLLLGGCSPIQPWVKPYEREHFADPIMSFNRDPVSSTYWEHVMESRDIQASPCGFWSSIHCVRKLAGEYRMATGSSCGLAVSSVEEAMLL